MIAFTAYLPLKEEGEDFEEVTTAVKVDPRIGFIKIPERRIFGVKIFK